MLVTGARNSEFQASMHSRTVSVCSNARDVGVLGVQNGLGSG
jgi:hypothetical protein